MNNKDENLGKDFERRRALHGEKKIIREERVLHGEFGRKGGAGEEGGGPSRRSKDKVVRRTSGLAWPDTREQERCAARGGYLYGEGTFW